MKSRFLLILVLTVCPAALASREHSAALTDDDVISMVQHGVAEDTILTKIKALKTAFDTSPRAAEILQEAGVSLEIIGTMAEAKPMGAEDGPPPTPSPMKQKSDEKQAAPADSLPKPGSHALADSGASVAEAARKFGSLSSGFNLDFGSPPTTAGADGVRPIRGFEPLPPLSQRSPVLDEERCDPTCLYNLSALLSTNVEFLLDNINYIKNLKSRFEADPRGVDVPPMTREACSRRQHIDTSAYGDLLGFYNEHPHWDVGIPASKALDLRQRETDVESLVNTYDELTAHLESEGWGCGD
ncbi:MAG TPA: hypothetical protein VIX19_17405 [Terriglobales bacterium]